MSLAMILVCLWAPQDFGPAIWAAPAVGKITTVLADPAAQDRRRQLLASRAEVFSTDRFVREVREIVATFGP